MTIPTFVFDIFHISPLSAALLAVAIILAVIYGIWQSGRSRRLKAFVASERERVYLRDDELPSVSVVVYATNDAYWLQRLLPYILYQDYPDFEVIVVDDHSHDNSKDVISDMIAQFPHLRTTFVPNDTRSLSRKKLALMMGIKAAKNDVIVTTNANCRVMSEDWLRTLMRNFLPEVDVVLGYAHYRYSQDKRHWRRYRIFDTTTVSIQYLNSSIKKRPYRGISDNLAFRREKFFENGGYSKSLDMRWGDDDIFVCEIANDKNTRIELARESIVQTYHGDVAHDYHAQKLRRDFTSKQVNTRKPFRTQALMSLVWWLRLLAIAGAVALDPLNLATMAVAVAVLIITWIRPIIAYCHASAVLQAPPLLFKVPLYSTLRPIVNGVYKLIGLKKKKNNFTSMYD